MPPAATVRVPDRGRGCLKRSSWVSPSTGHVVMHAYRRDTARAAYLVIVPPSAPQGAIAATCPFRAWHQALGRRAADLDRRRIYEIPYIWSSPCPLELICPRRYPGDLVCPCETMHGCHGENG